MVELHVFNLNGQLNSERAQICLNETLKFQTNYNLHIWTENDEYIRHIIESSPFCSKILSENIPYFASIYDYVKLFIMQKFGGWFFELDQIIETDLSKVDVGNHTSYFNSTDDGSFTATTWNPIYIEKGIDLSETIKIANEKLSLYLEQNEAIICKLSEEEATKANAQSVIRTEFSHIDTGSFNKPSLYGYNRTFYEKNGFLYVYYEKTQWDRKYYTFDVFEKISRHYNFFTYELPILCQNGEVKFTKSVYEKASKLYKLPENIIIIDDFELI